MNTARCTACGATIIWATHEVSARRAPIDVVPTPEGNVVLAETHTGPPIYRTLTKVERDGEIARDHRHTNHFATCPEAGSFRR